ncbi:Two component regulator propeller [Pedobacter hartonius]|uniref:histidine kinase n=1 Tax=Pedobacter hartonius TaxID=425514 RepID=A0A1H4H7Y2_9SPHI|nr:Two component regulator propeller [Pedobacter hartonius]
MLFAAHYLRAQPHYFRHYQVENGLSNNTVFCSVQDSRGLMWFGTKDGLNRFDGYSFKTYRYSLSKPKSLGNDLIFALHTDKNNTLWVGTNNGVYQYDPVNESFTHIKATRGMRINDICSDTQGNLWIISLFRVFMYNKAAHTFYKFENKAPFDATALSTVADGSVWVCTMQGTVERYHPDSRQFESHQVLSQHSDGQSCIAKMVETPDGRMVIGTTNYGIKLYDPRTKKLQELITLNKDHTPIFVRDMKHFSAEEVWIATESGVYIYHTRSGKVTQLQKQYSNPYSLSDNAVYTLCRDNEGGIWAGTYFGGINYYSARYSIFTKYFPQKETNSISGNDVREISKDNDGNFWIGTEDSGLNKFNPKTGRFTNFFPDGGKQSIAYSNIHGLLVDGNRLWIGTFEHGLDIMDIPTGKIIKHYTAGKGNALRTNFVVAFCKTRSGEILVATIAGIYRYNRKNDDFDAIPDLPVLFYCTLREDSSGNIWLGSFNDGVFRFRLNEKGFTNFRYKEKDPQSLSHNTVNNIFEDSRKQIWIATDGGGLCKYEQKTATFKRYTVHNGLPGNFIFRMEEDSDHQLWISSTKGLIRFNPSNDNITIYSRSNGLLTDQFNYNSSYKDTDGRLYFGSVKGLISFQPSQLYTSTYAAPMSITGFELDNNENPPDRDSQVLKRSVLYTDTIILKHNQSSFSLSFAALSYFSPEMTAYAYRMKGLYRDWEYLKTNRKVYFTKLAPGDYVFEVKALINGSNKWSQKNVKLFIRVLPPFWRSVFAYILYSLLIAGVISYFFIRYHKLLERKNQRRMELFENEKEKEIYQAKIEFFTNVAHEIRTPLTLIKGPMEKLVKQAKEIPAIEKNLKIMDRNTERLFTLTNQLLDFRKTEISGFSLNFVKANITEILREIALNFQDAAERKNISCHMHLPREPLYAYVDAEAFHKIISNLMDNAFKYGKTTVTVTLSAAADTDKFADDTFTVRVMSDGKRIPEELSEKIFEPFYRVKEAEIRLGTGIGLSISRSLSELHRGSLRMEKHQGSLNIFILQLPVHQLIEFNLNGNGKKYEPGKSFKDQRRS